MATNLGPFQAAEGAGPGRRTFLKTLGIGAVAASGIPLLSACTGGSGPRRARHRRP